MMKVYHNNRCSKSRQTLDLLKKNSNDFEVFHYLESEIDPKELTFIIEKLGVKAEDLVRKSEDLYKELFKGKRLSAQEWVDAMVKYPKLIERPIVINGHKVALGRPPENVLSIL